MFETTNQLPMSIFGRFYQFYQVPSGFISHMACWSSWLVGGISQLAMFDYRVQLSIFPSITVNPQPTQRKIICQLNEAPSHPSPTRPFMTSLVLFPMVTWGSLTHGDLGIPYSRH